MPGIAEGFLTQLSSWFGLPPGISNRTPPGGQTKGNTGSPQTDEFIASIVDITVDDVCIGDQPLFYRSDRKRLPHAFTVLLDDTTLEFNSIVAWAARDILKYGHSTYYIKVDVKNSNMKLLPVLEELEYRLTEDKEVKAFLKDQPTALEDVLIFINYDKESLQLLKKKNTNDEPLRQWKIVPKPLQLAYVKSALKILQQLENAIAQYRNLNRPVRFATVEVGMSKGDSIQTTIDDISSGLNANSQDMPGDTTYDDQIPVFPIRNDRGKPELVSDNPQFNISDMADAEYGLSKLFLALRFPKSYADFSSAMGETAASLIRGDVRYSRLIAKCRTILENAINDYMQVVPEIRKNKIEFKLIGLPTPEDDDVTTSLQNFTDFAANAWQFIAAAPNQDVAYKLAEQLKALYFHSTNTKFVEEWYEKVLEAIDVMQFQTEMEAQGGGGMGMGGPGGMPMGGDDLGDFDTGEGEEGTDDAGDFDTEIGGGEASQGDIDNVRAGI